MIRTTRTGSTKIFTHANINIAHTVRKYAERYLRHGYVNESVADAAEQCALDLMDRSAKRLFKAEVERLRRFYPESV